MSGSPCPSPLSGSPRTAQDHPYRKRLNAISSPCRDDSDSDDEVFYVQGKFLTVSPCNSPHHKLRTKSDPSKSPKRSPNQNVMKIRSSSWRDREVGFTNLAYDNRDSASVDSISIRDPSSTSSAFDRDDSGLDSTSSYRHLTNPGNDNAASSYRDYSCNNSNTCLHFNCSIQ